MQAPLQITFRDLDRTDAIDAYVRAKAYKLETVFERITRCHVAIESPHRHHSHGRPYRVRVDVSVPGDELVADRTPERDEQDLYAAIDAAFDRAMRRLHDLAAKRRDAHRRHSSS